MHHLRSSALAVTASAALALSLGACGSSSVTNAIHGASHHSSVVHSASRHTHRARSSAFCAYHGYRAVQDLRHQHPGWSAYQIYKTLRSCKAAVRHH